MFTPRCTHLLVLLLLAAIILIIVLLQAGGQVGRQVGGLVAD